MEDKVITQCWRPFPWDLGVGLTIPGPSSLWHCHFSTWVHPRHKDTLFLRVEERTGSRGLGTKAIPGTRSSYLSHPRHSRQGETCHCVAASGADLVFSSLDFVPSLSLNRP